MKMKRNVERLKGLIKEFGFLKSFKLCFLYLVSKNNLYIKYLLKNLQIENKDIIEKYNKKINTKKTLSNNIIWFFWWQGYDKMPEIPKMCFKQLKKNIPENFKIIFIDQNNYDEYAKMPEYIIKKLNQNKITLTHFSDLLRQQLLSEIGGIWIDSTVYCPNKLKHEELKKNEFWSVKLPKEKLSKKSYGQNISMGMYAGFILKNTTDSLLVNFVRECNFKYWKNHDYLIDYFIQIALMRLGYEKIPEIKKEIDKYPISNENLYELDKVMNLEYDENVYNDLKKKTNYFKLSWKKIYIKEIDGKETFYGHILNLTDND